MRRRGTAKKRRTLWKEKMNSVFGFGGECGRGSVRLGQFFSAVVPIELVPTGLRSERLVPTVDAFLFGDFVTYRVFFTKSLPRLIPFLLRSL